MATVLAALMTASASITPLETNVAVRTLMVVGAVRAHATTPPTVPAVEAPQALIKLCMHYAAPLQRATERRCKNRESVSKLPRERA
jgi:hypothetical protein